MTHIILSGPSSVGKTTYALKHYKNYYVIDSDEIWFELAKEFNWDKKKINKELFKRIYEYSKKKQNVVIVHTDATPLLKYFDRSKVIILLLATNFKNLAINLKKRKNRNTENILCDRHTGYLFYFESTDTKDNSLFLRKKDLDQMPVNTKSDLNAIENIKKSLFLENRKTARITPKPTLDYDTFIVI